eukprot:186957-Prorocentrum_minimum.AAC.1
MDNTKLQRSVSLRSESRSPHYTRSTRTKTIALERREERRSKLLVEPKKPRKLNEYGNSGSLRELRELGRRGSCRQ